MVGLVLSLEVRWQRKAGLMERDTIPAVSPCKCYVPGEKVYSFMGQSHKLTVELHQMYS